MAHADPLIKELVGDAERPYALRPERLYTRDDLMEGWHPGADHSMTLDGRIYAYVKAHGGRAPDVQEGLAQSTHDHFIDVALAAFLMERGRPVVGVMGGSRTVAADPNFRRIVHLAAALSKRG
jgi:xanthine/CO dehydrogenase XdhC/CoxF family maturation factor